MDKKNSLKKIISLLLAFCLTVSLALQHLPVISQASSESPTPEELGYSRVTIEEFGLESKKYTGTTRASKVVSGGLDMKYLDVDVVVDKASGSGTCLRFGGPDDYGITVYMYQSSSTGKGGIYIRNAKDNAGATTYADIGVDDVSRGFNLKLAVNYGDGYDAANSSSTCSVTYSFWVNDALIARDVLLTSSTQVGKSMSVQIQSGDSLTLSTPEYKDPTPEELGYSRVTIEDFGLESKKYTGTTIASKVVSDGLDMKYLDVGVVVDKASGSGTCLRFGGPDNYGITVYMYQSSSTGKGGIFIRNAKDNAGATTYADIGVDDVSRGFNLKLAVNYGDGYDAANSSSTCSVTYSFWVNDALIARDVLLTSSTQVGKSMSVQIQNGDSLTLSTPIEGEGSEEGSDEEIEQATPEELGYSRVTIEDFGFQEGPYTSTDALKHNVGTYADVTLDMKYLDVDITFSLEEGQTKDTSIRYGSTGGWTGIQIARVAEGLLIRNASSGTGAVVYSLEELGLENLNDEFNLKFATDFGEGYTPEKSATCDVTYSLWINDVLIAKDVILSQVAGTGKQMALYTPKGSIKIMIPSDEEIVEKTLPTDYRKLTFASFGLANAKHEYKGNGIPNISSDAIYALDKTLFSGDVYFTKAKGADFRYGGKGNAWYGLQFYSTGDGTIRMAGATGKGIVTDTYTFRPFNAGTQLVDTWVNIKITTFIIDSDNDGNADDVELGVWFNDKLYDNEYIYLQDYAQHLGDLLGVYVDRAGSFVELRSDKTVDTSVDFALFGYTKNWEKEKLD